MKYEFKELIKLDLFVILKYKEEIKFKLDKAKRELELKQILHDSGITKNLSIKKLQVKINNLEEKYKLIQEHLKAREQHKKKLDSFFKKKA